ncbi:hypothetical protein NS506_05249 [Nocardia seriolae]|uniref:Uncharacterized protein n=1 Tax=Nocardia seriolae TaxID=37332 RepID=A0ABC8AYS7_9NOCA|nr:hypothetical protein [Nocardia seriolae]APA99295.1 hypothetical protein NS506_05249 [Nocardia seriolae]MTJ88887.1 hypothetical protein [Nocardia seriolae]BAW06781.1 hypothetical protein NSERUTF1_3621 [Nocardia seriolae]BEK88640.1 hypothetical protein NSERKGN1266_45910 [Nocardia seriolae]BEK96391.1 hypothetical protein NSER024013_42970 [Nocardia seriolae]
MIDSQLLRYTLIETTADGGSAFVDAEIPLAERTFVARVPAMAVGAMSRRARPICAAPVSTVSRTRLRPGNGWSCCVARSR